MMIAVSMIVKRESKEQPQEPRSAGPDYRMPFSMGPNPASVYAAEICDSDVVIQGSRALGVTEGDQYTLQPWNEGDRAKLEEYTVTVKNVDGFTSTATQASEKKLAVSAEAAFVFISHRQNPEPIILCGSASNIQQGPALYSRACYRLPSSPVLPYFQRVT